MFPYIELFGTKIYMTGVGIVIASIVFLITTYQLCKKYNQDFVKLFNWLPWLLIAIYVLGLYLTSVFDTWSIIPTSLSAFSPYGYRFSFVGIVIACFLTIQVFLLGLRRSETKKIWIDIFFFWFVNALAALGFFLLLGENFVWKETASWLSVSTMSTESSLMKFEGVYPIGIFLSIGALLINVIVTMWKRGTKKVWLGIWGFVMIVILFLAILPFWNYSRHGVLAIGNMSFDLNHYVLLLLIFYFVWLAKRLRKPY